MAKKTKDRVQLSQETVDKMLEEVYKNMTPEARFAFDSRAIQVFLQNTDEASFADKHTKHPVVLQTRDREPRFTLEQDIINEMINDITALSLLNENAEYRKYSYCFYTGDKTTIKYAKSVSKN